MKGGDKEKLGIYKIETARENQMSELLNSNTLKGQVFTEPSFSSHRTRPQVDKARHHQLAMHYPGFSFSKITRFDSNIYEKFKSKFSNRLITNIQKQFKQVQRV